MGRESSRTHWEISYFDETASAVTLICFRGDEIDVTALLTQVPELSATWTNALSVRHFYRHHTTISTFRRTVEVLFEGHTLPAVTSIPCHSIATRGLDDDWDYAMFIICA